MGNQLYKLNIHHNSTKTTIMMPPDNTVLQLKETIQSTTGVAPCQQVLFCKAKVLRLKNKDTLEETGIESGSIITVMKIANGATAIPCKKERRKSSIEGDKTCIELGNIEIQVLGLEKESLNLKYECLVLAEKGPIFPDDLKTEFEQFKNKIDSLKHRLESSLDTLDKLKISQENHDYKTRKKKLVDKIIYVLDQTEKIR